MKHGSLKRGSHFVCFKNVPVFSTAFPGTIGCFFFFFGGWDGQSHLVSLSARSVSELMGCLLYLCYNPPHFSLTFAAQPSSRYVLPFPVLSRLVLNIVLCLLFFWAAAKKQLFVIPCNLHGRTRKRQSVGQRGGGAFWGLL